MSYYQPPAGYQPYNQFGGYQQPPTTGQQPPTPQHGYNNYQQPPQQPQPPGYGQPPSYQYQPSAQSPPHSTPPYQQPQSSQGYSTPTQQLSELTMKWLSETQTYQQVLDGVRSVAETTKISFFEPQRAFNDTAAVLWDAKRYTLSRGEYFSNFGEQMQVLQLKGLLPITFRNSTYKTPLLIHIPSTYPTKPPIIYVTPTPDLRISPKCPYVQPDGLVTHNYLNNWNKQSSTIALFLQHLSQAFGEAPPLFAAQPGYQAQTNPTPPSPSPVPQQQPQYQTPYGGATPPASSQPHTYEPPQPTQQQLDLQKKQQLEEIVQVKVESAQEEQFKKLKHQLEAANVNKRSLHRTCFQQDFILEARTEQLMELNRLDSALDSDLTLLRQLCSSADHQDDKPEPNSTDHFVDQTRVVLDGYTKQLIMEDAGDSAIDDVLMQLDNLLNDSQISLDSYLKEVRTYARKQFLSRTLSKKIMDQM